MELECVGELSTKDTKTYADSHSGHSEKVGVAGFEPATSWSQTMRDNRTTLHPETNFLLLARFELKRGEGGIRTLGTVSSTTV